MASNTGQQNNLNIFFFTFSNLRSIMLYSCFDHQNENVCLPLAANVGEICKILFDKPPLNNTCDKLTMFVQRSSCMIDSMGCWGTGCLFQINGRSFVITCAHVLRTVSNKFLKHCSDTNENFSFTSRTTSHVIVTIRSSIRN